MRVADIHKVNDGELFIFNGAVDPTWSCYLGGYSKALLVRKGYHIYDYNSKNTVVRGFFDSSAYYNTFHKSKQDVQIFKSLADVPREVILKGYLYKINSHTGTDPEIFVVRGGKTKSLLPAFRFLPSQSEAKKISTSISGGAYGYKDGFAAECYVPPQTCHGYLMDRIRDGLRRVLVQAREFDRTSELTIQNTFTVPEAVMKQSKDEDIAFGCNPSLNAYDDNAEVPANPREFLMRFSGGHVHLGMKAPKNKEEINRIVQGCDFFAAIPCVAIFAALDTPARRQCYGRAGEFRMPPHGLEYRVLSNAWLSSPEVAHLVFNLVRIGAKIGKANWLDAVDMTTDQAREIINFCDVKSAREFVKKYKEVFVKTLIDEGVSATAPKVERSFMQIIMEGVEAIVPTYRDVEENWKLTKGAWREHSDDSKKTWAGVCNKANS